MTATFLLSIPVPLSPGSRPPVQLFLDTHPASPAPGLPLSPPACPKALSRPQVPRRPHSWWPRPGAATSGPHRGAACVLAPLAPGSLLSSCPFPLEQVKASSQVDLTCNGRASPTGKAQEAASRCPQNWSNTHSLLGLGLGLWESGQRGSCQPSIVGLLPLLSYALRKHTRTWPLPPTGRRNPRFLWGYPTHPKGGTRTWTSQTAS